MKTSARNVLRGTVKRIAVGPARAVWCATQSGKRHCRGERSHFAPAPRGGESRGPGGELQARPVDAPGELAAGRS